MRNIRALKCFLRFVPKASGATGFFEVVLAMPLVRRLGTNQLDLYWAGEASMFEVIFAPAKDRIQPERPETAPCVPIFRVNELPKLIESLTHRNVEIVKLDSGPNGDEAFIQDTDGQLIGLRQRRADAGLPHDIEARRRRQRGEAFNPGCRPMPSGFQELGWIRRRVQDVPAMTYFYHNVLGLPYLGREDGHALLDLGDNVILELCSGGRPQPIPGDRYEANNLFVLRVDDIGRLRSTLQAAGVAIVNDKIEYYWGELLYFADPEGQLVGAEEAFHPRCFAPAKQSWPEGLEAERRWRESIGAQS